MGHTSRISDYEESISNGAQAAQEWVEEAIDARPLAALCGVFAAGFAIGAGIGCSLAASAAPRRSRSRMPHLDQLSSRISEAVANAIPRNLGELFGR